MVTDVEFMSLNAEQSVICHCKYRNDKLKLKKISRFTYFPYWTITIIIVLMLIFSQCLAIPNPSNMSSIVLQNESITNYQSMEMKRRDRRFLGFDQPIIDSNPLPMLYIGEVDLSEFDECEYRLEPYRTRCQREYETYLRTVIARRHEKYILAQQQRIRSYGDGVGGGERSIETKKSRLIKPFVYSKNDEYIKQASCCGIWRARHCIIDSIEHNHNYFLKSGVCPNDLIHRFISLPNEPTTRVDVLDYCSEYSDGSLICSGSSKTVAANKCQIVWSAITSILLFLILPNILFG